MRMFFLASFNIEKVAIGTARGEGWGRGCGVGVAKRPLFVSLRIPCTLLTPLE
jgi:hypothetical protein